MDDHFLFYVPSDQMVGNQIRFSDEETRHISKVLRKRPGDVVRVTDGSGLLLTVRLFDFGKREVCGEVIDRELTPAEFERILALGVIRQRDRLEFAIEKAVELGATRLVLVHSDNAEKVSVKASRIDKIIISAMKQSRRTHLPQWEERESFSDTIAVYRDNCKIFMAHPGGSDRTEWMPTNNDLVTAKKPDSEQRPDDLEQRPDDVKPQLLLVGPEGGFSDVEVGQAVDSGAELVSLGPTRLRAETAVCAILTLVRVS